MRDYAELIKAFRFAFDQPCYSCVLGEKCNWGDFCFFKRSADAIEELLKENGELENSGRVLMAAFARLKEKVPHWISVEERLPEESGYTIVYCANGDSRHVTFAKYQKTPKRWELTGARSYWRVLKWMPLPEEPKEGNA